MKLSDYNYQLPKNRIALTPPKVRGDAKLLVLYRKNSDIADRKYANIIDYLEPGDVLVLNDTKVIKARLEVLAEDGKTHELLLLEKHGEVEDVHHHKVLVRGQLITGERLRINEHDLCVVGIYDDGTALIESQTDLNQLVEKHGEVPLPPYMKRAAIAEDVRRYQTEFAKLNGSVAAPTASLNLTKELIKKIEAKGVKVCYLTLHVGLGTFLPIRTDDIKKHKMHSEWFHIPPQTAKAIRDAKQSGKKVTAVGTTVARTLEYAIARHSELVLGSQAAAIYGEADIFIYPGYEFKVVDQLLTNFHAPKSTVLMLAAAFAGWPNLHAAYEHALSDSYQFLSYGDSMLII